LEAFADEPLLIENPWPGIIIHYKLEIFRTIWRRLAFYEGLSIGLKAMSATRAAKKCLPRAKMPIRQPECILMAVPYVIICPEWVRIRRLEKIPTLEKTGAGLIYLLRVRSG